MIAMSDKIDQANDSLANLSKSHGGPGEPEV
jgi:hypothetical protein